MIAELITALGLEPHVEGGSFRELYREGMPEGARSRAASGVIYYALDKGEHSEFHHLDSDEYWLYHAGDTVEIWIVDADGHVRIERLGIEPGASPCVLLPRHTVFGARLAAGSGDGCVMSCVTVPEFTYEHYHILSRDEVTAKYPETIPFFEK